jgi:hypothetical protein
MKGRVEVFSVCDGKRTLVLEEDNLIMDGAGETIVDMLTTTSSIALSGDATLSAALDASNYCIQGFTFGKGESGYLANGHSYKQHNLLVSSNLSLSGESDYISFNNVSGVAALNKSLLDGSSQVYKVQNLASSGGSINWTIANLDDDYYYEMSSLPRVFSVDVKADLKNPPVVASDGLSRVTISIIDHNASKDYHFKFSKLDTDPSSINSWQFIGFEDSGTGKWAYVKSQGSGWYKLVCVLPPSEVTATSDITEMIRIYPGGLKTFTDGFTWPTSLSGGSLLISRPSYNIGSVPIEYFVGDSGITTRESDASAAPFLLRSVMSAEDEAFFALKGGGTLTNTKILGVFELPSYNVIASLPEMPNPNAEKLQAITTTPYEKETALVTSIGHNLNIGAFSEIEGTSVSSYISPEWTLSNGMKALPIQKDLKLLGSFKPTELISAALVSGLNYVGYLTNSLYQTYPANAGYNYASSVDMNGYVRVYYPTLGESSNIVNRVVCTSESDFSSTGQVKFSTIMDQADRGYMCLFGGVFQLGLYTLNVQESRKKNNSAYSSFDKRVVVGDDLVFRLFSSKTFGFDITHRSNPNFPVNAPLTINWTVDFL